MMIFVKELMEKAFAGTGLEESYDDYYWSVKNRLLSLILGMLFWEIEG